MLDSGARSKREQEHRARLSLSELLWRRIERIEATLALSPKEMAEYLELTAKTYETARQWRQELPVHAVMALAARLNFDFSCLFTGELDYKTLARQYQGDKTSLPERYSNFSFGRRRSVVAMLDVVENRLGWEKRAILLRRLQLTEAMFANPSESINMRCGIDICNHAHRSWKNDDVIFDMGRYAVMSSVSSLPQMVFSGSRNPHEFYEYLAQVMCPQFFERNYHWEYRKVNHELGVFTGRPSKELQEFIEEKYVKAEAGCTFRAGFLAQAAYQAGFPLPRVWQISCAAWGATECRFGISFEQSKSSGERSVH